MKSRTRRVECFIMSEQYEKELENERNTASVFNEESFKF